VPPELQGSRKAPNVFGEKLDFDIAKVKRLQEVARLARSGQTDAAVALFRELTGKNEAEARDAVEAIRAGRPFVLSQSQIADVSFEGNALENALSRSLLEAGGFGAGASGSRKGISMGAVIGIIIFLIAFSLLCIAIGSELASTGPLAGLWQQINPNTFARTVKTFGQEGSGPGYFQDPRTIAVDPMSGRIFVADYDTGRVQAFDQNGKFLFQWQVNAQPKPYISGLAAGYNGKVYAVLANSPILVYDGATGNPAGQISYQTDYPSFQSVFALPDGSIVAIANDEDLLRFNAAGEVVLEISAAVSSVSDNSELTAQVAASGLGDLYILGTFNYSVFHYSAAGKYISRFGGEGEEPGQLSLATSAIAVDAQGRVYLADMNEIKVYSSDGRYLQSIQMSDAPMGLAFDNANNLYAVTNKPEVVKMTIAK
jgi:DNA-binding beta-propeller fold protein YncE